MAEFLIIGFNLGAIIVAAAITLSLKGRVTGRLRFCFLSLVGLAGVAAFYSTYIYVYFTNPNTRYHGWPIPTVVFQRDDANSPWLDFVGLTSFLAYPMNLILFLLLPSVLILAWMLFVSRSGSTLPNKTLHPTDDQL